MMGQCGTMSTDITNGNWGSVPKYIINCETPPINCLEKIREGVKEDKFKESILLGQEFNYKDMAESFKI